MPRYSTASESEDFGDYPSPARPLQPQQQQLNSTPRFQLPFNNNREATPNGNDNGGDDSEEEEAWDEVDIPNQPAGNELGNENESTTTSTNTGGVEIVIRRAGDKSAASTATKKKSTALTPQERQLRQERHKVHVMSLLAMGLVRNHYLNDRELQARLISHLPSTIHASLVSITRERYPNPRDRSRLFEACLKDLTSWWYQSFQIVPNRELKRNAISKVEQELNDWQEEYDNLKDKGKFKQFPWEEEETLSYDKRKKRLASQSKSKSKSKSTSIASTSASTSTSSSSSDPPLVRPYQSSPSTWEPISSISSLYAAAANLKGSRDLSSQLFVALLRGLDVPARLIISLQGMEWRSDSASGLKKQPEKNKNKNKSNKIVKGKGKGKGKQVETIELSSSNTSSDDDKEGWEDGRGKMNYKVPKVNLRKSGGGAGMKKKMAGWEKERLLMKSPSPDPEELLQPPTQWPEAYSRYLKEWVTLDPTRKLVRCKNRMEPSGKAKGSGNALVYVVGFEEDGSAHDVTPRYAKSYNNATVKLRVPTSSKAKKDNGGKDWFATVLQPWKRKFELNRDKVEEEELWNRSRNEPFPTSFGGFKNHPNFVLEQHLHRDEALVEGTKPLGLFKSTTPVFPRSAVLVVKSTENWYRIGRSVKSGEIPRKFVKGRAVTINSKRREELIKLDGGEVDDQPLYSQDQTEVYVPDPVIDGKVPKNSFGNIDLFTPSMLPQGAVHLPSKLAVKCAKMLRIDFAEAIIGFEFRQRRATPTMAGIVVAAEHEETLREAIANLEQQTLDKTLAQQQDRVLKRWKKLITGLRIRQRLQGQFKDVESGIIGEAANLGGSAGSASGSNTGTPRFNGSASNSPAPQSNSNKKNKTTSTTTSSSATRKRPTRSRRSPSSEESASPSSGDRDYSDSRPPPRKKRPTTRRSTLSTRSTTVATGEEGAEEKDQSSSLKIRLPALKPKTTAEAIETIKRPTRASAIKAKQNLAISQNQNEEEEEEEQRTEENEDDTGKVGMAMDSQAPSMGGGFLVEKEEQSGNDDGEHVQQQEAEVEEDEYGFEYESD